MDLKKLIGSGAPILASMLGGPLAGSAVGMISKAVLGREDATEQEVMDAIQADPEALAKVKVAEIEAETTITEVHGKDREGARTMHVTMKDVTTPILSWVIVAGFFGMVAGVFLSQIDASESQLIALLIGYVASEMKTVTTFYFGSSKGSRNKDVMKYAPQSEGLLGNLFKKRK